jgi:hypothetical protein
VKSASHIREKESSLWATPNTMDILPARTKEKLAQAKKKGGCKNLREDVINYPTPRTSDAEGGRIETIVEDGTFKSKRHKSNQTFGAKLRDAVETFPTPMARDYKDTPTMTPKDKYPTLPRVVHSFPTPSALEAEKYRMKGNSQASKCLSALARKGQLQNWGTPKEQDSRAAMTDRGKHNMGEQVHGMYNQSQDQTNNNTNGKSLELNPSWVEQLMGLQVGWTDCDFSEME